MKKACPVITVLFILCVSAFGQQQTPTPAASPSADDDVVRITTKLVQLDLLVLDKDGKQVRDLKAEDFEVRQDGKPQAITNFSYVNTEKPRSQTKESQNIVQTPVKPGLDTRLITFVVDDGNCIASNTGMIASREALEKFVREQMQSNDLVAIYQTRSGNSLLQQYTGDKALLLKIARRIQWRPALGCGSSDGSFYDAARTNEVVRRTPGDTTTELAESGSQRANRENIEDSQANNQVVGTLGVLRYLINGLRRIPGRKVVFFLSDGMTFRGRTGEMLSAADRLRDLTDLANRSSVVFNTVDARGVTFPDMIEARDEVYSQTNVTASDKPGADRYAAQSDSRDGLAYLARETGGEFYRESNFLDVPIGKALARETGYYLIAYDPADETFKGKKFNKIEIKVNRPGLKVVSRAGFLGSQDEPVAPRKTKSEDSDLYEAIAAPLPRPGLDVRLTAYFVNSAAAGNVVRVLFQLDGRQITFLDDKDKDSQKKAAFDVVAVTLDEKNKVVDEFFRSHIYKVQAAAMPVIQKNGLIYSTDVLVKKPGTYNFRVAVKDTETKQIGSSSQVVEIPDLKKTRVFVSGMMVAQVDKDGKFAVPEAAKPENAVTLTAAVPAIRRFRRGSIIAYAYTVYNAQLDPANGQPKLSVQTKLYHNGQLVIDGKSQNAQLDKQPDWTRIYDYGYLQLKPTMEPGDYNIQIIITDLLAKGKNAVTSQSVDFEVVE
ncbi:MAG: VWA domain-containing protein [Pyrinomonadaceae bacterium]